MNSNRRTALATVFHEEVNPTRVAFLYLSLVVLSLGISLPVIAVTKQNAKQNHIEAASVIASSMASYIDAQFSQIYAAVDLFYGFAASAAPLHAPDYVRNSVAERVSITTSVGTAGALSIEAYNNVLSAVTVMYRGFRNALVQPGIVNIYAPNGSYTAYGDWLNYTRAIRDEYFYMVNTTNDSIYGPLPNGVAGTSTYAFLTAVRRIIWTNLTCPTNNRSAFDPVTGWHENWKCVWGAITVVMDLLIMAQQSNFPDYVGPDFEYLFESYPRVTVTGQITPYAILNASHDSDGFLTDAMNCAETPGFENLCFRVMPASGNWNGHDMSKAMLVAALLEVFLILALILAMVGFTRLVVGPLPNPLQYAPMKPPFHVVVIDMVGANQLWNEVPFVMNEVMSIFNKQLELLTEQHRVHTAVRLGNTVLVASGSRNRIVALAQEMLTWAHNFTWPPLIAMHCPNNTIQFTFILHSCYNASVRLELESRFYEIVGPDVQTALALRVAAIPGQLICTNVFIGVTQEATVDGRANSTAWSSEINTADVTDLLKQVRELGVCEVPVPCELASVTRVTGYLIPSAGTAGRKLHDVMDNFEDWVWAEWRNPRALEADDDDELRRRSVMLSAMRDQNPLEASFEHSSGHTAKFSASRLTRIGASSREAAALRQFDDGADCTLPASAVDLSDARGIAFVLAKVISHKNPRDFDRGAGETLQRLRETLSLATYFFIAYRVVFGVLDQESQRLIVLKSCLTTKATSGHDLGYLLAARCARVTNRADTDYSPDPSVNE
jgi:hypothetical protein